MVGMIGREAECKAVRTALDEHRLVTLHAPGGTGKTTLALAVAGEGAPVARLADAVTSPRAEMAAPLGAAVGAPQATWEALPEALAGHEVLLVLDNVEGVEDLATDVPDLLAAAPGLRVLATGQVPLGAPGEHVVTLAPLEVPEGDDLESSDAGRLYLARGGVGDDRAAVADLLRLLEGVPLAVELAAARARVLDPRELLTRLRSDPSVLRRRGASGRHASLTAALDWTLSHASAEARALHARLAAFTGGWTRAHVRDVCATDPVVLDELVVLGLARSEGDRYSRAEAVSAHAARALAASGEEHRWRRRHAEVMLALTASPFAVGLIPRDLGPVRAEEANLLAALRWAAEHAPELHHELSGAMGWWAFRRGHAEELLAHAERALGMLPPSPAAEVRLDLTVSDLAWARGDVERARASAARALERSAGLRDVPLRLVVLDLAAGEAAWARDLDTVRACVAEAQACPEAPAAALDELAVWEAMTAYEVGDVDRSWAIVHELDARGADAEGRWSIRADLHLIAEEWVPAAAAYAYGLERKLAEEDLGAALMRAECIAMAAADAEPAAALALAAAAERQQHLMGSDLSGEAVWTRWRRRFLTPARTALGPAATARAEERGRGWTFDRTVDEARALAARVDTRPDGV